MPRAFQLCIGAALVLMPAASAAQGTGGLAAGGTGAAKSRPDFVEEDLVGTPHDVRTLPRAPTLPDLTHHAPELSTEHTIASLKPRSDSGSRLTSHLFHFDVEGNLLPWLYVGGTWGFAAARAAAPAPPPGQPPASDEGLLRFVAAQPQIFGRVVHVLAERYAIGAGFGVMPPVVTYDDKDDRTRLENLTASSLVSVVRPWDLSSFLDRRFTLRPWIDLRATTGRFVVQLRQGFDANLRTAESTCAQGFVCERAGDIQLLSISTLYVGWQPTRELALGVEAWEVYLLKTQFPVSDRDRSVFALSPSIRWFYRWVEPAVSLLVPVGPTLLNAVDSYFAMRIDLRVWFGGR